MPRTANSNSGGREPLEIKIKVSVKLGVNEYHQPDELIAFAQAFFLQVANEIDPRPLAELHASIFPQPVEAQMADWCRRWNFVFDGWGIRAKAVAIPG